MYSIQKKANYVHFVPISSSYQFIHEYLVNSIPIKEQCLKPRHQKLLLALTVLQINNFSYLNPKKNVKPIPTLDRKLILIWRLTTFRACSLNKLVYNMKNRIKISPKGLALSMNGNGNRLNWKSQAHCDIQSIFTKWIMSM